MHGLIFETSIWLLAGSTRLLCVNKSIIALQFSFTAHHHKPLGTNSELIWYEAACREGSFCTVFHTALTHAIDTTSLLHYSCLVSHKVATCLNTALITLEVQLALLYAVHWRQTFGRHFSGFKPYGSKPTHFAIFKFQLFLLIYTLFVRLNSRHLGYFHFQSSKNGKILHNSMRTNQDQFKLSG